MEVITKNKSRNDLWRWYPLKPHPTQYRLVHDRKRFPVVSAGRRSGKTEESKRFGAGEAITTQTKYDTNYYFFAAPVFNQAKRIYWQDVQDLTRPWWRDRPSKSDYIIFTEYKNVKSEIHIVGLDRPERIEGSPWNGGVIDEYGNVKPNAWVENVFPALGDRDGWCWRIGVPEGRNHYYTDALDACGGVMPKTQAGTGAVGYNKNDPTAGFYTWFSADILTEAQIEVYRRKMDERTFKQEMEGEFLSYAGVLYYTFSESNISAEIAYYNHQEPIILSCDFNKSPLSWGVMQRRNNKAIVCDEINIQVNAKTQHAAEMFAEKYRNSDNKLVYLTGDASGNVETTHDHSTDYMIIEDVLQRNGFNVRWEVPKSNPNINNRLINDLYKNVSDNKGGKDKSDPQQTHASDWFDYGITWMFDNEMWGTKTGQSRIM